MSNTTLTIRTGRGPNAHRHLRACLLCGERATTLPGRAIAEFDAGESCARCSSDAETTRARMLRYAARLARHASMLATAASGEIAIDPEG